MKCIARGNLLRLRRRHLVVSDQSDAESFALLRKRMSTAVSAVIPALAT